MVEKIQKGKDHKCFLVRFFDNINFCVFLYKAKNLKMISLHFSDYGFKNIASFPGFTRGASLDSF